MTVKKGAEALIVSMERQDVNATTVVREMDNPYKPVNDADTYRKALRLMSALKTRRIPKRNISSNIFLDCLSSTLGEEVGGTIHVQLNVADKSLMSWPQPRDMEI